MANIKQYREKSKLISAMLTYVGQPLHEIRDFTLGCRNLDSRFVDVHLGFDEPIRSPKLFEGICPGDYIVIDHERNVSFMKPDEFEEKYEEKADTNEIFYVVQKYGFSLEDAESMLKEPKIRAILLKPLEEDLQARQKRENRGDPS